MMKSDALLPAWPRRPHQATPDSATHRNDPQGHPITFFIQGRCAGCATP